jgi:hypothetical protein
MGKPEQCVPSRASGGRRHVCQRTGIHGFPLQKGNLDETSDEPIIAMTDRRHIEPASMDAGGDYVEGKT